MFLYVLFHFMLMCPALWNKHNFNALLVLSCWIVTLSRVELKITVEISTKKALRGD